jgi:uncharacterized damage-inducible protein DinB
MPAAVPLPVQPFLDEIRREGETTRRLLQVLPEARLAWKPHPRSQTLGQLAMHVATLPGGITGMLQGEAFDFDGVDFTPAQPQSKAAVLDAHDQSQSAAAAALDTWRADDLGRTWRVLRGGSELMAMPKSAALRNFLCNHLVHHRGQLTVYLRLLDVPLPSVYGPTADENPFA